MSRSSGPFDIWAPRLIPALAFLVPLFFMLNMEDTFDLPKLVLVYTADLVLLALWIGQQVSRPDIRIRFTALDVPLLVFLAVTAVSVFFSIDRHLSLFGSYKIYVFGAVPMAAFAVLFWLTAQCAAVELPGRVVTALRWAAACAGAYALLQFTGNEIFERMPKGQGGRVWSSLGNPLYMGALCMMATACGLGEFLKGHRGPGVILPAALALTGVILSLSRSAWLGMAVALVILGVIHRAQVKTVGLIFVAILVLGFCFSSARQRMTQLVSLQESSNAARLEGWKAGLRIWKHYPLLGSGPDTFVQSFRPHRSLAYIRATGTGVTQADAHNDLIQFASTEGTLGVLALLGVVIVFLRKAWKTRGTSGAQAGLFAAIAALIVQNQFNFSAVSTSAWAAIGAGILLGGHPASLRFTPLRRCGLWLLLALCPVGLWAVSLPLRADIFYKQGLTDAQNKKSLYALQNYRQAVALNGSIDLYRTQHANAARDVAQLSSQDSSRQTLFSEAWNSVDAVTLQHPHNPDGWNNRGVAAMWLIQLSGQDYWDEAKRSFDQAVTLDPFFMDAWANLARWQHLKGNLAEEKILWHKVLEIDPQHAMAREVLGEGVKR